MGRWSGTGGYHITVHPDKPAVERDTTQCVHCMKHWVVEPGSGKQRGWCSKCNGPHCGGRDCWVCVPFIKKIEEGWRRVSG
jgi:hypothetical protein